MQLKKNPRMKNKILDSRYFSPNILVYCIINYSMHAMSHPYKTTIVLLSFKLQICSVKPLNFVFGSNVRPSQPHPIFLSVFQFNH